MRYFVRNETEGSLLFVELTKRDPDEPWFQNKKKVPEKNHRKKDNVNSHKTLALKKKML